MKRSVPMKPGKGFTRKVPLRAAAPAKTEVPLFKMRKCPVKKGGCGAMFRPLREKQIACMAEGCAQAVGAWQTAAKAKAAHVEDVKQTRAALEALKPLNELRGEAQEAFRWFIRERDRAAGRDCICCGAALDWNSTMPGGAVDAGHYLSRGSAPELAFDERNTSAQRKGCNRPGGTTRESFRAGMVRRWGEDVVAELEGPIEPKRYRHDDYRRMRDHYRREARHLQRSRR